MSSAATTTNLCLPQWAAGEKPERTDFNAAFLALDGDPIYGSNANGAWIKFSNGIMGCFHVLPTTITNDATFVLGGLTWYQSARNWTYPVEFYSIKSSVTSCRQNTNNSVLVTNNIVQIDVTAVIVNSLTSFAAYGLTAVYCEAWGRWKA